jgi:hypothetical protein
MEARLITSHVPDTARSIAIACALAAAALLFEVRPAGALQACPPGEDRTRTMFMEDGEVARVEWSDASCEVEVLIEGAVTFDADFAEFATISRGGRVRITERGGGVERQLEIRPGPGGELRYTWRVSGREAPFDAEARAWLQSFVPELLRTSGIAAEQRVAWLVRTQGSEGLFREIPLLRSDRPQRKYLAAWFGMGAHPAAEVARAVEIAGAQLASDRELAAVLSMVGPSALADGSVRRAFLGATATIESDREIAGLLMELMDREALSGPELELVLASSHTIHSDRELAAVLLRVIDEAPIEGSLRDPFMEALGTIESDREYGTVASALFRGTGG